MSLTTEIKSLLTPVDNVRVGNMPDLPDNAICIYRTGGFSRQLTASALEEPTFQIKVRNTNYVTGEALCDIVKDLLNGSSTSKVLMIQQMGDTLNIGRDTSNRQEWTINFRCYYLRT